VEQYPEEVTPRILQGFANFNISNMEINFDTATMKHPLLIPILTTIFRVQIKKVIELKVEKNLSGWINKLGDKLSTTMGQNTQTTDIWVRCGQKDCLFNTTISNLSKKKTRNFGIKSM